MSIKRKETNCPNCGAPIADQATQCPYCGTRILDFETLNLRTPQYIRFNFGTVDNPEYYTGRFVLQTMDATCKSNYYYAIECQFMEV